MMFNLWSLFDLHISCSRIPCVVARGAVLWRIVGFCKSDMVLRFFNPFYIKTEMQWLLRLCSNYKLEHMLISFNWLFLRYVLVEPVHVIVHRWQGVLAFRQNLVFTQWRFALQPFPWSTLGAKTSWDWWSVHWWMMYGCMFIQCCSSTIWFIFHKVVTKSKHDKQMKR